jgi:hypothetical protein
MATYCKGNRHPEIVNNIQKKYTVLSEQFMTICPGLGIRNLARINMEITLNMGIFTD